MIDVAFKVLEALLKLRDEEKEGRQQYFDHFVRPTYEAAEAVFGDYVGLLTDIRNKVESGESKESLIRFMEERRLSALPVRMRLRALLARRAVENKILDSDGFVEAAKLGKFELGIWGLLLGGLGSFEDSGVFNWHNPYGRDRHTLLSLVYERQQAEGDGLFLRKVDFQKRILEEAWQDVVTGYADLQTNAYPAP